MSQQSVLPGSTGAEPVSGSGSGESASGRTSRLLRQASLRPVALWLFGLCLMIFMMVVIGGVTRLTGSGLSMVEWKPLLGWLPPISESEWVAAFRKYKLFPEYALRNAGMTLAEFKGIFWLEYIHRLWGRLIGVAFLLPFLWFWMRGRITRRIAPRLVLFFVLGAAQGVLGWWMVKSGLVDRPDVSQYRLVAHLGLAVLIYALMFWTALRLWDGDGEGNPAPGWILSLTTVVLVMVALTMVSGGFVAGLDAGLTYNTFPLMDGRWVPPAAWRNGLIDTFTDVTTVQFNHRLLAGVTFVLVVATYCFSFFVGTRGKVRIARHLVFAAALVQVIVGIATLMMQVPVPLAALHQAGALALLTAVMWMLYLLRKGDPLKAQFRART